MWQRLPPWILERLFTWVQLNADTLSRNGELARLGRVCRPWSLVALNLLWSQCSDLTHLLPTLPVDILQSNGSRDVLELTRILKANELTRFTSYSRRIRELHYHHQSPGTRHFLDSSILFQLHDSLQTLFPNLQRLYFASGRTEGWKILRCLVSPQLNHLVLDFRLDFRAGVVTRGHIPQYLAAVHDACMSICSTVQGSLRTLVTKIDRENEAALAPIFAEMVQHLPRIRKLQIPLGGVALASSFHQLCQMKDLIAVDIKVHVASFEEVERVHNAMPPEPFKKLRTLYLESTISFYQPIIRTVQSNILNSIRLVFREQCPLPTESFNSVIQATCSATSSLQVFELTIHTPSSRRLQSNLPTTTVLLPLFAHRKLQELVIDLGVPIQLTDTDIDTIACLWPKIWKLRLISGADADKGVNDGWKPLATCRAITTLFYHLRHLTELAIEFDASTLDELAAQEKTMVGRAKAPFLQTSNLKTFDAGRSVPGKPLCVASWFAVVCPKLQELQWTGESRGWERTCEVLLRIQEREEL